MKPISNMAFYCCGARMDDAALAWPICGDGYASLFMDDHGRGIYERFRRETTCTVSMVVRHRVIDQWLRAMLARHPDACFVSIGAGFDSRPYRLAGGRWIELDEPQVIAYKNERLPASQAGNPLERVPIDFATDSLEDKLSRITHDGPVVFILEGIFIYLNQKQTHQLIETLHKLFPEHWLVCDLVNRDMVEKYGQSLRDIAGRMNACFKPVDQPERVFARNGYQVRETISLVEASVGLGLGGFPTYFLKYFFKPEVEGNSVYVLQRQRVPPAQPQVLDACTGARAGLARRRLA